MDYLPVPWAFFVSFGGPDLDKGSVSHHHMLRNATAMLQKNTFYLDTPRAEH
jgi:hypothetical protein